MSSCTSLVTLSLFTPDALACCAASLANTVTVIATVILLCVVSLLCRSCELKEPGAPEPQCCLCPLTGGGLKPTTLPGMWAHAACMQWIPEVTCLEPLR
jgi:hypothetical protein